LRGSISSGRNHTAWHASLLKTATAPGQAAASKRWCVISKLALESARPDKRLQLTAPARREGMPRRELAVLFAARRLHERLGRLLPCFTRTHSSHFFNAA